MQISGQIRTVLGISVSFSSPSSCRSSQCFCFTSWDRAARARFPGAVFARAPHTYLINEVAACAAEPAFPVCIHSTLKHGQKRGFHGHAQRAHRPPPPPVQLVKPALIQSITHFRTLDMWHFNTLQCAVCKLLWHMCRGQCPSAALPLSHCRAGVSLLCSVLCSVWGLERPSCK